MTLVGQVLVSFGITNFFGAVPRKHHIDIELALHSLQQHKFSIGSKVLQWLSASQIWTYWPGLWDSKAWFSRQLSLCYGGSQSLPFGCPLEVVIFVNTNHAHGLLRKQLLTTLLIYIGSTPVLWCAKRQGSVATSVYVTGFTVLKHATEHAIYMHYYLHCFGVAVPSHGSHPYRTFQGNYYPICFYS